MCDIAVINDTSSTLARIRWQNSPISCDKHTYLLTPFRRKCDMQEHPFAPYVRILGRGKSNSRPLTIDEAEASMAMILASEVLPEQIGAFLMLLRFKEEQPEEIAGFVKAAQATITIPNDAPKIDLDWSCYAGKRRQLPWFALAAMALAQSGVKVFIHGTEGHTAGRIYADETFKAIGLTIADNLTNAAKTLKTKNICYLPLKQFSPKLADLIELKSTLGLRSPAHTIARMLNPFKAGYVLQGIFHPGFNSVHQKAAALIGQPHLSVFRGEGGEIERRPQKPVDVLSVHEGTLSTESWPALLEDPRQTTDPNMDLSRLKSVWQGDESTPYAQAAIIGTLAIALTLIGKVSTQDGAHKRAGEIWENRNRTALSV
jgi:anthranilate phosphoribosyltransferase